MIRREPQPIVLPERSAKRQAASVFPSQVSRPVVRRLPVVCDTCAGAIGPNDNYCGYCGVQVPSSMRCPVAF